MQHSSATVVNSRLTALTDRGSGRFTGGGRGDRPPPPPRPPVVRGRRVKKGSDHWTAMTHRHIHYATQSAISYPCTLYQHRQVYRPLMLRRPASALRVLNDYALQIHALTQRCLECNKCLIVPSCLPNERDFAIAACCHEKALISAVLKDGPAARPPN